MRGSEKRKKLGQCEHCKGKGYYWGPAGKHGQHRGMTACPKCKGTGKLPGVEGPPSQWQKHVEFLHGKG